MKASSRPSPGLTERRTMARTPPKTKVQTRPSEVAIMIQPVWSVSVTTTKGGDCPGGTEKAKVGVEADMSTSKNRTIAESLSDELKQSGLPAERSKCRDTRIHSGT